MNKYGISDINHFGVLKVSLPLVLIFAFLTRHWWLSLGVMMSRSPGVMGDFFDGSVTYFLVAEFPALLVCAMALNRKPTAGKFIRAVWKQGLWLLSVSVLLNLALIVLLPTKAALLLNKVIVDLSQLDGAQWGSIAVNVAIIAYFVFSTRTRDTFAEFPSPPDDLKP
jgi:hypothetical protein